MGSNSFRAFVHAVKAIVAAFVSRLLWNKTAAVIAHQDSQGMQVGLDLYSD